MVHLIVSLAIVAIVAHKLIFNVALWIAENVCSFVDYAYHRVRSFGSGTYGRHSSKAQAWVRVANGACLGLDDDWQSRQLSARRGQMRLHHRLGIDVTLPVSRIDRLNGDQFGAQVPDAYLEVVVPADRLDWVLHQLGHQDPPASNPPAPPERHLA